MAMPKAVQINALALDGRKLVCTDGSRLYHFDDTKLGDDTYAITAHIRAGNTVDNDTYDLRYKSVQWVVTTNGGAQSFVSVVHGAVIDCHNYDTSSSSTVADYLDSYGRYRMRHHMKTQRGVQIAPYIEVVTDPEQDGPITFEAIAIEYKGRNDTTIVKESSNG
jgi:hypothetical protein